MSDSQQQLEALGFFVEDDIVAVTEPGSSKPFLGARKYIEIREPRARKNPHELSCVQDGAQGNVSPSTRVALRDSSESEVGERGDSGTVEGDLDSPSKSSTGVVREDVADDTGIVAAEKIGDESSCDGSEIMEPVGVRDVQQGGDVAATSPTATDEPQRGPMEEWRYECLQFVTLLRG